jgi:hypothetical protein
MHRENHECREVTEARRFIRYSSHVHNGQALSQTQNSQAVMITRRLSESRRSTSPVGSIDLSDSTELAMDINNHAARTVSDFNVNRTTSQCHISRLESMRKSRYVVHALSALGFYVGVFHVALYQMSTSTWYHIILPPSAAISDAFLRGFLSVSTTRVSEAMQHWNVPVLNEFDGSWSFPLNFFQDSRVPYIDKLDALDEAFMVFARDTSDLTAWELLGDNEYPPILCETSLGSVLAVLIPNLEDTFDTKRGSFVSPGMDIYIRRASPMGSNRPTWVCLQECW